MSDSQWTAQTPVTTVPTTTTAVQPPTEDLYAELETLREDMPSYEYTVLTGGEVGGDYGQYGDMPVAVGHYDESGNLVIDYYSSTLEQQQTLAGDTFGTSPYGEQFVNPLESEAYTGLQGLLGQLGADQSGQAMDWVNQLIGGDYGSIMQNLQTAVTPGVTAEGKYDPFMNMAGLPEEQRAQYEQALINDMQNYVQARDEILDAIAPYSSIEAFNQMDEISNTIANAVTQSRLKYMEMDLAQKQLQYETIKQNYDQMLSAGMAGTQQYYDILQNQQAMTLQTYMQMMNATIAQDQMAMDQYAQHIDQAYKSIMTTIGVETNLLDTSAQYYSMNMTPWLDQYDALLSELETGMGLEAAQGGTVICTELHRQGRMSDRLYAADSAYGWLVNRTDPLVTLGYRWWAKRVVKWMQTSAAITWLVSLLALPWAREMAYRIGRYEKGNIVGKLLFAIGMPICRFIGKTIGVRYERASA